MSFIPLIKYSSISAEHEGAVKYFLVQSIASLLILGGAALVQLPAQRVRIAATILLPLALIIKLGAAPFHQWLPPVINSLRWRMCAVLST